MNTEEVRLWAAVLATAVNDSMGQIVGAGSHTDRSLIRREAVDWIMSADKTPGSFLWIADVIGYDASYARGRIRRYASTRQAKPRCFRAGTSVNKRASRVHTRPLELQAGY
jgi:hypothetical protein